MMPVREAVSRLVADQAIEVTRPGFPRTGDAPPPVRGIGRHPAEIEGFAAERAAIARSAVQLKAIIAAERRFRDLAHAPKPDLAAAVEANQAFHFAIFEASGLADLVELIGGLWLKVGPVINLDLRENPERLATGSAAGLHQACAEAVARGDGAAARASIAADIAERRSSSCRATGCRT